jgi:hypothetical protein
MKRFAAVLIAAGIAVPLGAQSLADVAARDKERRAREGAKGKAYSDSDLKPSPSPGASPASSPTPGPSPSTAGSAPAGTKPKGWRAPESSPAPPVAAQPQPAAAPATPDPNEGARMAALEAQWRAVAAQRRNAVAQADATLAALRERVSALRNDMSPVNVADPNREQNRQAALAAAIADLEAAEAGRAAAQTAVDNLETDVRRAGGLPGWVR